MAQAPERRTPVEAAESARKTAERRPRIARLPNRKQLVARAKARLSMPRLQMAVIVAATGGAGFLASYLLLEAGLGRMWLRYPLAVGLAYLVFFLLLRVWLAWQRHGFDPDLPDLGLDLADGGGGGGGGAGTGASWGGKGGSFGGGGASSSFESPGVALPAPSSPAPAARVAGVARSRGSSAGSGFDLDLDLDELLVVAVVAALALSLAAAAVYVVSLAPVLLAEVLADGLLSVGLYRRLKRPHPGHWAAGALRRTWVPALVVAVLFTAAGAVLQQLAPEARSIGGAWRAVAGESG